MHAWKKAEEVHKIYEDGLVIEKSGGIQHLFVMSGSVDNADTYSTDPDHSLWDQFRIRQSYNNILKKIHNI